LSGEITIWGEGIRPESFEVKCCGLGVERDGGRFRPLPLPWLLTVLEPLLPYEARDWFSNPDLSADFEIESELFSERSKRELIDSDWSTTFKVNDFSVF
jgi:hypothetical protein